MPEPPAARGSICLRCFTLLRDGERCDLCGEPPVSWRSPEGQARYREAILRRRSGRDRITLRALFTSAALGLLAMPQPFGFAVTAASVTAMGIVPARRAWRRRALLGRGSWPRDGERLGRLAGDPRVTSPLTGALCLGYFVVLVDGEGRAFLLRDAAAGPLRVELHAGAHVAFEGGRLRVDGDRSTLEKRITYEANPAEPFRSLIGANGQVLERCLQPGDEVALTMPEQDPYRGGGAVVPRLRLRS